MPRPSRPPQPLDRAALERIALRYVERFATTRAKLAGYLFRKIRERGWNDNADADPVAVAERMAALGYIDDRAFAEARASALTRRGLGGRRVTVALRQAGIEGDDAAHVVPAVKAAAGASALAFARRRRIGPYAAAMPDRASRERAMGAMLRAGHDMNLVRRIIALAPGSPVDEILADLSDDDSMLSNDANI